MIAPSIPPRLVRLSCLAPSVHNTQPWLWRLDGDRVHLYADRGRALPAEDPVGRNLTISCGAALDHLVFAAHALGWRAEVDRLPQGPDSDLLATVSLVRTSPSPTAAEDIETMRTRCTDRRRFTSWPVPDAEVEALAATARRHGIHAVAMTDVSQRFRLEVLSSKAHELRRSDAGAVAEERHWVGRPGRDGIPLEVVPNRQDQHQPRSRFGSGLLEETRNGVESGDGVIVLGGRADEPGHWLRVGEALSALWLRATRAGISVVPLSLPIEVESVRKELQDLVLGDAFVPHLIVRLGWQAIGRSDLPRTPRRSLEEVLLP